MSPCIRWFIYAYVVELWLKVTGKIWQLVLLATFSVVWLLRIYLKKKPRLRSNLDISEICHRKKNCSTERLKFPRILTSSTLIKRNFLGMVNTSVPFGSHIGRFNCSTSGDRIRVGGEIFRTCLDLPLGPPSLLYNGYRVFPGGKERPGRDDPSPPSSAVVMTSGKSVPLQAWSGSEGSRKLRFPDFMTTAHGGGKDVSLTHRPHLPPGNPPGTHFC